MTGRPYFFEYPFKGYKDFLTFMEEEYMELGHPDEYAKVMELFRTIDSEFDEKHNLWFHVVSNDLRKKAMQERAQKVTVHGFPVV